MQFTVAVKQEPEPDHMTAREAEAEEGQLKGSFDNLLRFFLKLDLKTGTKNVALFQW